MEVVILVVLGLCLGSFVNALVWRVHKQALANKKLKIKSLKSKKPSNKSPVITARELSILKGRSMCVHCYHELSAKDLIPLLSWLTLKGKCRYCHKSISWQYPVVELATAGLFAASYFFWPEVISGVEIIKFGLWLLILTGLIALAVYDLKWFILPDRIVKVVLGLAILYSFVNLFQNDWHVYDLLTYAMAVAVGGGIFYFIFQISDGKWIGGGDVKLGAVLGLIVGGPLSAALVIFIASLIGTTIALPFLASGKLRQSSHLPFGPMLITGCIVVVLYGARLISWYQDVALIY